MTLFMGGWLANLLYATSDFVVIIILVFEYFIEIVADFWIS